MSTNDDLATVTVTVTYDAAMRIENGFLITEPRTARVVRSVLAPPEEPRSIGVRKVVDLD